MIGWEEEELPLSAAQAIAHARLRTSLVALRPAPSCPSRGYCRRLFEGA